MKRVRPMIALLAAGVGMATPALARDYGQQGAVWPVVEPDLLAQIHARLAHLEKTGETARLCAVLLLAGLGLAGSAPAQAAAGPGRCTGKFVNPITDICWSCLFPISVGGLKIWPYLRQMLDRFGTVHMALAAYNAGPGAVERAGGIPLNGETPAYVRDVLRRWRP